MINDLCLKIKVIQEAKYSILKKEYLHSEVDYTNLILLEFNKILDDSQNACSMGFLQRKEFP